MPIRSDTNLYPGVNPHLNSALQKRGGAWPGFHTEFVVALRRRLDAILPEHYFASTERGMQIALQQDADDDGRVVQPRSRTASDVQLFQISEGSKPVSPDQATDAALRTLPLSYTYPTIIRDDRYPSVVIFQTQEADGAGKPVTRLELLSPSNMPGGSHHSTYRVKRYETLLGGMNLVEMDFLHETSPVLPLLPSYKRREADAYPYYVIVSDLRGADEGVASIYAAGILQRLPVIELPLSGQDSVALDLQAVYDATYSDVREFHAVLTDYAEVPVNFGAYTEADQQAIRQHMAQIAAEHAAS